MTSFKIGDKVTFGRPNGEQTAGTVVKVNPSKLKIRQDEERGALRVRPEGTIWSVPPSMCRLAGAPVAPAAPVAPKAKRANHEIMFDIQGCYNRLSPENLSCDGECSRTEMNRRAAQIRAQLRTLFAEYGRVVSEDEAWGQKPLSTTIFDQADYRALATRTDDVGEWRKPTAKQAGFKAGDKVQFTTKGQTIVGFVRQSNVKTVTVDPIGANAGRYWRVSPSCLQAA